jgi:uncharacterized protein
VRRVLRGTAGATGRACIVATALVILGAPSPAPAFDCTKARTEVELAICASPEAKAIDDRMAAAYVDLKGRLNDDAARALRDSQRQWLKYRDETCTWRADAERTQCVIDETEKRWRVLSGLPKAGPGTGSARLEPYLIARKGDAKKYAIDITAVVFAAPATAGERAFNEAVAALHADAPLNETIDFESPGELSYNLHVEVLYASSEFVSALGTGWRYDGGAHGNSWTRSVTVDLKAGRLLSFADLFPETAREAFANICRDQLVAQRREKLEQSEGDARRELEAYETTISEHMADLSRWSFAADRVEVIFDPYAVGSYAEGEYVCRFDYGVIRLYANPDVALPG